MIQLLTAALAVLRVVVEFVLEIRKRKAEAAARVATNEKEKADIAGDIHKRRGTRLARRARTLRLTVRELLRDPKLRQDLQRIADRRRMVSGESGVPKNGRTE